MIFEDPPVSDASPLPRPEWFEFALGMLRSAKWLLGVVEPVLVGSWIEVVDEEGSVSVVYQERWELETDWPTDEPAINYLGFPMRKVAR